MQFQRILLVSSDIDIETIIHKTMKMMYRPCLFSMEPVNVAAGVEPGFTIPISNAQNFFSIISAMIWITFPRINPISGSVFEWA